MARRAFDTDACTHGTATMRLQEQLLAWDLSPDLRLDQRNVALPAGHALLRHCEWEQASYLASESDKSAEVANRY